jgi:hypothetical protein
LGTLVGCLVARVRRPPNVDDGVLVVFLLFIFVDAVVGLFYWFVTTFSSQQQDELTREQMRGH